MSSFPRRMQRVVSPSAKVHPVMGVDDNDKEYVKYYRANPPRREGYMGRGEKLGVSNPKDTCLIARTAREHKKGTVK